MGLHSTEAIVIGGHNLGEADRIIPFFTRRAGKVRAVAAGARRIRSRFGGTLELFTYGRLVYFERPNRDLHRINEFAVLEAFPGLRSDLDRLARGAYLCDLAGALAVEAEANEALFGDALGSLLALEQAPHPDVILRAAEVRALRAAGFQPEVTVCVRCRGPLPRDEMLALSPAHGGLLCPGCRPAATDRLPLSPLSVGFLRGALEAEWNALPRVEIPGDCTTELERALQAYLLHVLGRPLRTLQFLTSI